MYTKIYDPVFFNSVYVACISNIWYISVYITSSMENYKSENALMVVRRKDTSSKPPLKTSTYKQSRGNRLHWIEPSGKVS